MHGTMSLKKTVIMRCLIFWLDGLFGRLMDLSFTQQQWIFATVGTVNKSYLKK
jgi:hypothetical protein